LNGIMMSCLSWTEFIEPFSAHNKLILVDFLDQGRSSKMTDQPAYDHSIQIEVVKSLLDHLGLEKVSIAGISYGSEVALGFAVKYQQYIDKLLLFNATARTGPWLRDIGEGWLYAGAHWESYYYSTIPVIYSPQFYREHNDWMERRKALLKTVFSDRNFIDAMERLTNSSVSYDVSEKLGEIKVPTLVVSCEQDYLIPVEEQKFLVEHMPNAHHVIVPHSGHASMYEQPVLYASLVIGFVNNPKMVYNIV
ncbi:MAG: alpha/beta hydrolase, partial [Lachnospiraceae bacterium]|nr:alpha/beta hydrolase [Lachnospiraceae bacterium]